MSARPGPKSVEPRSVFLRKEIIKFALNLPIKHKINIKNNSNFNTKIILKKLFIKHFSKKLIFKKQGFAGFPNEMVSFLGTIKNFRFIKYFSLKKFNFLITNYNKATLWKIYNTEFFLRNN